MKKLLAVSSVCLGALAFIPSQAQAFVLIDNFNTGDIFEEIRPAAAPGATVTGTATGSPTGIISNGIRDYSFNVIGTGRPRSTLAVDGAPADGGLPLLSVSNPPGVTSTAEITYTNGNPFNLALNSESQIGFNILNNDLGATVKFIIDGVESEVIVPPTQIGPFAIPFTDFTGVDFTSVASIKMIISGPQNYDIRIDNFGTNAIVPEPMTILGTAFALTTLPGLKKAYSKKKAKA
jgi:hypothetical protein